MILLDTNIIIEVLKNNKNTIEIVNRIGYENICISYMTLMEIFYGAKNKKELNLLAKYLQDFEVIYSNINISKKSVYLIKKYSKSHNLQIPDAIIAATVTTLDIELFTYNLKDFKYIEEIKIYEDAVEYQRRIRSEWEERF